MFSADSILLVWVDAKVYQESRRLRGFNLQTLLLLGKQSSIALQATNDGKESTGGPVALLAIPQRCAYANSSRQSSHGFIDWICKECRALGPAIVHQTSNEEEDASLIPSSPGIHPHEAW